jgi:flagellar protein FliS
MPAEPQNLNPYLRTKVLTASPEELRLMLLDGAVKFARQGREGLAARNYEATFNGFSRCRNILVELMSSMRPDVDPLLAKRITSLYTFLYTELLQASIDKDVAKADRVIELIEYERETWSLVMKKLTDERTAGSPVEPAASPAAPAATDDRAPLCIQG